MRALALVLTMAVAGILLGTTEWAWPCQPSSNLKTPTWQENFSRVQTVVFGTVRAKVQAPPGFQLEFQPQKFWKRDGKKTEKALASPSAAGVGAALKVKTKPSNTCNPFGTLVEAGSVCVLFVDDQNLILSGIFDGDSSICLDPTAPRSKWLLSEYETKFSMKKPKPK